MVTIFKSHNSAQSYHCSSSPSLTNKASCVTLPRCSSKKTWAISVKPNSPSYHHGQPVHPTKTTKPPIPTLKNPTHISPLEPTNPLMLKHPQPHTMVRLGWDLRKWREREREIRDPKIQPPSLPPLHKPKQNPPIQKQINPL